MRSRKSKDKQYNGQKKSQMSFWPLYCLFFDLRLLIVHLAFLLAIILLVLQLTTSHCTFGFPFGHYIACPSTYDFSLHIWLSFWPLYCLSFDLRLLIVHLAFLLAIILLVLLFKSSSRRTSNIYKSLVDCATIPIQMLQTIYWQNFRSTNDLLQCLSNIYIYMFQTIRVFGPYAKM
jgi:hypothetical protein